MQPKQKNITRKSQILKLVTLNIILLFLLVSCSNYKVFKRETEKSSSNESIVQTLTSYRTPSMYMDTTVPLAKTSSIIKPTIHPSVTEERLKTSPALVTTLETSFATPILSTNENDKPSNDDIGKDFPSLVVNANFPKEILLYEMNGNLIQKLELGDNSDITAVEDGPLPCTLFLNARADFLSHRGYLQRIFIYNIHSKKASLFFETSSIENGYWVDDLKLSPAQDWVSYSEFSGEQRYSGGEFQNIVIVPLKGSEIPIRVSTSGTVIEGAAWSHTSNELAFSDSDGKGNQLLVLLDPNKMKKRTIFSVYGQKTRIGEISWSPNDKLITFILFRNYDELAEDFEPEIWLINLENMIASQVELEDSIVYLSAPIVWNMEGNEFIVEFYYKIFGGMLGVEVDGFTSEVIFNQDLINQLLPESGYFTFPFVASPDLTRIGFLSSEEILFFDKQKRGIQSGRIIELPEIINPIFIKPLSRSYKSCP